MAHIAALRLTDFRSYASLDLALSGQPVVLFGPNGSGKTNLLEAISFLSPGRGLRRAKLEAIARQSPSTVAPAWGIRAEMTAEPDDFRLNIGQVPEQPRRRLIRIDGKSATGTQLAARVKMLWLTPAQDRLFTGGASDRRRFLDRLTLAHRPDHGQIMLRYEKARAERNRLLSDGSMDQRWYEALETDLAAHGALIAEGRALTLERLVAEIRQRPEGNFPKADIQIEGQSETDILNGVALDTVEHNLRQALADERPVHMRAGRTLTGIHRSDLHVRYTAKAMPASACSTGEQKALLITLILAHAHAQQAHQPILLLDEIAAHLDIDRRAAMVEELVALGTQIFMTGTDKLLFDAFADRAQMFAVSDGQVSPAP